MIWFAKFMRYGTMYTQEFDTEAEAFRFLAGGEDAGTLSSVAVVGPEHRYEHGDDEFYRRMNEAWATLL